MTIIASIVWHSCDWLVDLQRTIKMKTLYGVQMLVTLQALLIVWLGKLRTLVFASSYFSARFRLMSCRASVGCTASGDEATAASQAWFVG